jgi:hypothetical protein
LLLEESCEEVGRTGCEGIIVVEEKIKEGLVIKPEDIV